MKKLLFVLALSLATGACTPRMAVLVTDAAGDLAAETPIVASLDLTKVTDDRVMVEVDPGLFTDAEVLYRLPRVLPGTYAVSDFGRFTDDFKAYDYAGAELAVEREDASTWRIAEAPRLDRITYFVNDTYDLEQKEDGMPFSPAGTNIAPDIYVLNLHGFIGYFEGMDDSDYEIRITAPAAMQKAAALPLASSASNGATVTDVYLADRYFEVTDNPMLYGTLDTAAITLSDIDVTLAVYSPTRAHSAAKLKPTLERTMTAQRAYLGDIETTDHYDVFLYLAQQGEDAPTGMGALEHHTSTVMTLPEAMPDEQLGDALVHTVSHEFFHIVQPLTIHSEDIHFFDYHSPTFSKHLWFYEGQTEYFANHFQVYEGLIDPQTFYQKIAEKIEAAEGYAEPMSFTEMSEYVTDEPYAANYANVYMKGALIGMCNDVLVRAGSDGERSLMSVMRELSRKYGKDRPFEDDTFIEEFTAFTTPEVGDFLNTHVVGSTPIDYAACLEPVGLTVRAVEGPSTLFLMPKPGGGLRPFLTQRLHESSIVFPHGPLSSTLEDLGVQGGDMLKTLNGVSYSLANIQALAQASMTLTPESEVHLVVERDGAEVELSGTLGQPTGTMIVVEEVEDATPEQLALRAAWLGQPMP